MPFNLQIKTSYFQLISSLLKVNDIQLQDSLNFFTKSPVLMSLLVNLTGLPVNKQIRKDYTLQIQASLNYSMATLFKYLKNSNLIYLNL